MNVAIHARVPWCAPVDGLTDVPASEGRKVGPMPEYNRRHFATFTVYLGGDSCFDHWGNPATGATCYVGKPSEGRATGGYGDRYYWRSMIHYLSERGFEFTEAGATW